MKQCYIFSLLACVLFACKKNEVATSAPDPLVGAAIDNLSDEVLKILDSIGVDNTFTFDDALFADGSSMREWELQNDTAYFSQFTRTTTDVSDKELLFISRMIHRARELDVLKVSGQKNGLAYVYGSKSVKDITIHDESVCREPLAGLDCSGMIYQMAKGSGLNFESNDFGTGFFSKAESWNKAFDESSEYKGLKMIEHIKLDASLVRSGDIIVSAGNHVGMVVLSKDGKKLKFYHSSGASQNPCAENSLEARGPTLAEGFKWFFKYYPNYSILRVRQEGVPGVTTKGYYDQTHTSVTFVGEVTNDAGSAVTARGICWSTHPNPTVSDNFTVQGEGVGKYESKIQDLLSHPFYYARAYATNSKGTSYGLTIRFSPLPDSLYMDRRDGKTYTFRHIGKQVWMTVNLNFFVDSDDPENPVSCTYPGAGGEYGHLYTYSAARQAIPEGWRLPSDDDYLTLLNFVASVAKVSSWDLDEALKSRSGWDPSLVQGNNISGFSALAAGARQPVKEEAATNLWKPLYGGINFNTWWWKSNEETISTAHIIGIHEQTITATPSGPKEAFFSVRCIRNN